MKGLGSYSPALHPTTPHPRPSLELPKPKPNNKDNLKLADVKFAVLSSSSSSPSSSSSSSSSSLSSSPRTLAFDNVLYRLGITEKAFSFHSDSLVDSLLPAGGGGINSSSVLPLSCLPPSSMALVEGRYKQLCGGVVCELTIAVKGAVPLSDLDLVVINSAVVACQGRAFLIVAYDGDDVNEKGKEKEKEKESRRVKEQE